MKLYYQREIDHETEKERGILNVELLSTRRVSEFSLGIGPGNNVAKKTRLAFPLCSMNPSLRCLFSSLLFWFLTVRDQQSSASTTSSFLVF